MGANDVLNGVDPLLVIILKKKPPEDLMGPPAPTGFISSLLNAVGVPIPIYLSERGFNRRLAANDPLLARVTANSGIIVDSESRSIDVNTKVESTTERDELTGETKPPEVTQTAVDTLLTVNLVASRDSVILTALVAIMELIVSKLVSREYSIHYINKSTVIFGGLLHRFATSINPNEDKMQIELVLSTAAKESPTPKPGKVPVENLPSTSLSTPPGV